MLTNARLAANAKTGNRGGSGGAKVTKVTLLRLHVYAPKPVSPIWLRCQNFDKSGVQHISTYQQQQHASRPCQAEDWRYQRDVNKRHGENCMRKASAS